MRIVLEKLKSLVFLDELNHPHPLGHTLLEMGAHFNKEDLPV